MNASHSYRVSPSQLQPISPTRREIIQQLGLSQARVFVAEFDRPNICYRVVLKQNAKVQLLDFLKAEHPGDAGIVYCLSRAKVEEVAQWLVSQGWNALPYHEVLSLSEQQIHHIQDPMLALPEDQHNALKPVFEALQGTYNYGILRCVRAGLMCKR